MLGLYIHIPFCKHICTYCDFYKMVASDALKEKTIHYMMKEIELKKIRQFEIDTLYIGGGTPSILPTPLLEEFLSFLSQKVNFKNLKEFTIEMNPEDIREDLVLILSKYHVNRVSIGIQSFNPKLLKFLGRPYTSISEMKRKIALLNRYGIYNINLDLIYAIPSERFGILKKDVQKMLKLNIRHLSTYSLILEEHTILNYQYEQNQFQLSTDALDEKMYHYIVRYLKKKGFVHYETSNFAISSYESKHNLIYWSNDKYLAIGPSASSYVGNYRFTNVKNLNQYFEGIDQGTLNYEEMVELTLEEKYKEEIMLGLRCMKGINSKVFFSKYGVDLFHVFPQMHALIQEKLLEEADGYIRIPEKYSYIANHIIVKII